MTRELDMDKVVSDLMMYTDFTNMARQLRLSVTRNQLDQGNITRDEACEVLRGQIDSNDPESAVDDSALLDLGWYEALAIIKADEKPEGFVVPEPTAKQFRVWIEELEREDRDGH